MSVIGPFGKCTTVPPAVDVDGGPDGVLPEPAFKFDTGAVGDDGGPDTETWFDVDDGDALMIGDVVDAPIPNDADAVDVDVDDVDHELIANLPFIPHNRTSRCWQIRFFALEGALTMRKQRRPTKLL